jgi:ABC-2 type transport system ATP-binding protein
VIDHGRVIARGTADELKARVGGDRIELTVDHVDSLAIAQQALAGLAVGEIHLEPGLRRITVPVSDGSAALVDAIGRLAAHEVTIHDVGLRRPSLDDVFLTLTGHDAQELVNGDRVLEKATEGQVR